MRYWHRRVVLALIVVLTLERQHKGSYAPSIRSVVVDEERMKPGHCFVFPSVL